MCDGCIKQSPVMASMVGESGASYSIKQDYAGSDFYQNSLYGAGVPSYKSSIGYM